MAKSSAASGGAPSSKSLLFMMIAMTCGFCVLLGGGLLMASRVLHALGLREASDKSTVRTPLGDYRFEKASAVGPGLPVYPQSSLVLPGTEAAHAPADDGQPQVVVSTYHSNSSREYIINWYLEHLSPEFARQDSGPKNLPEAFRNSHVSDDDVTFVGKRGDQVRVVSLSSDGSGTTITLMRSSKAPNPASTTTPVPTPEPAPQSPTE